MNGHIIDLKKADLISFWKLHDILFRVSLLRFCNYINYCHISLFAENISIIISVIISSCSILVINLILSRGSGIV